MHERGLDLIDFFRGKHSWRKLLNLIGRLPLSSAFREAQLNDPEFAEWLAAQPEGPDLGPRLAEWTPEVAELVDIKDRIGELIAAVISTVPGAKVPKVPASPRPTTAVAKARARARRKRVDDLVAEVKEAQKRWEETHAAGH